jgi:hypothetical protein
MNYFERLIRRALLEVPVRAGDALHDPFENEAPLALDVPVQKPAMPPVVLAPPAARENAPEMNVSTHTETHTEHHWRPDEILAPAAEYPGSVRETAASRVFEADRPEPVAPLARADAFMHALGVEVARVAAPPVKKQSSQVSIAPDAPRRTTPAPPLRDEPDSPEAIPSRERPPSIVPPVAPRPQPQSRESPVENAPETQASRREAGSSPSAPGSGAKRSIEREIVREKIHVVKVLHAERGTSAAAGAAPPTFGAAQL